MHEKEKKKKKVERERGRDFNWLFQNLNGGVANDITKE